MTIFGTRRNVFHIKEGDTAPALATTLVDENGPLDLTSAVSVGLSMRLAFHPRTVILDRVSVTFAANGDVSYQWAIPGGAVRGTYFIEWVITYPGDLISTVPTVGFDVVVVGAGI